MYVKLLADGSKVNVIAGKSDDGYAMKKPIVDEYPYSLFTNYLSAIYVSGTELPTTIPTSAPRPTIAAPRPTIAADYAGVPNPNKNKDAIYVAINRRFPTPTLTSGQ